MGADRTAVTFAPSTADGAPYEGCAPMSRAERAAETDLPPASGSVRPTPLVGLSDEPRTDVPSARPTSIPDIDPSMFSRASLLAEPPGVLADIVVPVQISVPSAQTGHRAAFLLAHVDGVSTIAEIAAVAALPVREVIACFVRFVELGVVELLGAQTQPAPCASGVFPRIVDADVDRARSA